MYPYTNPSFISFIKNIKWSTLLDGTQKTLGVINQAIPIVYQVKPMVNNAKTLFKIANSITTPDNTQKTNTKAQNHNQTNTNKPIFYI